MATEHQNETKNIGAPEPLDLSAAGDEWLETAYQDHGPAVFNVAAHIGGRAIAEDVTQEVFLRLWSRPDKFDPDRGSLGAFLMQMARSMTIDMLRSNGSRRRREDHAPLFSLRPGPSDDQSVRRVLQNDVAARVWEALQHLKVEERDAIVMAFYGELTYSEAARVLNEAEGTVKGRIRSGLRRLRLHIDASDHGDLELLKPSVRTTQPTPQRMTISK